MLLRTIDFETSNADRDAETNGIIEVGCTDLLISKDGKCSIENTWSELCDPERPITPEASAVHHLTNDDVKDQPKFVELEPKLFEGNPDFFIAHNADFERALFTGGEVPWICTYKVALRIWPELPRHSLQYLRYALELDTTGHDVGLPHRAGPDTIVCALLMKHIIQQGKFKRDEMVRFSNGAALLPRMPMGKYRGKAWDEVPTDYLEWMVNSGTDFDRDVMANAKHHLKTRQEA